MPLRVLRRTLPPTRPELLVNGSFETAGFAGWTQNVGDGALVQGGPAVSGTLAVDLSAGVSADTYIRQTVTVAPGYGYVLTFWTRGDGSYEGRYGIYDVSNSAWVTALTGTGVTGTSYVWVRATFVVPATCSSIYVYLYCPSTAAGEALFDDVSLKQLNP